MLYFPREIADLVVSKERSLGWRQGIPNFQEVMSLVGSKSFQRPIAV